MTLLNPYRAPKLEGLKETALDIRARDARGQEFIVEMQAEKDAGFERRVLYCTGKRYVQQIEEGEAYRRLRPVIFLGVLDFVMFESPGYMARHLIVNPETGERALKDFEFNFIELPKFRKTEEELRTLPEHWVYFLKNVQDMEMAPSSVATDGLREAYAVADKFAWTPEELELYEYQGMQLGKLRGQFEAKWLDGLRQGREEGARDTQWEIARRLLDSGMAPEQVAQAVGLSAEALRAALPGDGESRR